MLRLVNLSFMLILFSFPAYAQAINDEGAARVKALFERMLNYQKEANEMFATFNVIYDGTLQVEQKETYYAVTFPHVKAKGIPLAPSNTTDVESETFLFDVGVIKVNVSPSDKDGEWKTIWTVPSKMTMSSTSGEDLSVSFKEQKTLAVLDEKLGYFTKVSANFSDFSISESDKEPSIKIGSIQLYNNFEETEGGAFSGPFRVLFENNIIANNALSSVITAKNFMVEGDFTDLVLPTLEDYLEKLKAQQSLFAELEQSTSEASEEDVELESAAAQQQVDNLMKVVKEMYSFDIDGMSFNYKLDGLNILSEKEGKKTETILDTSFFGGSFNGLKSEKGSMDIKFGYAGLTENTAQKNPDSLVPKQTNIDIKFENVPYVTLTKLGENTFQAISENPENAQFVGLGVMMRLPTIMSQANTRMHINNNLIENDLYSVKANGSAVADLVAALGFTVDFKASFAGLEKVITILEQQEQSQGAGAPLEQSNRFVDELKNLREMGQKDGDVYNYHLQLSDTGQFTVNGQDFVGQKAATTP